MGMIWVLVADKSRARLFKMRGRAAELSLDREWEHPASRLPDKAAEESAPDSSGNVDETSQGNHSTLDVTHEAELFAQELISEMEKGAASGCFLHLYLIAAPEFLGLLRKKMGASLKDLVEDEVAKNLTTLNAADIRKYLSGAL